MANTLSAMKALRQAKKRSIQNQTWKSRIKNLVKSLKTEKLSADILEEKKNLLESLLDKAVKNHVFHKNKAARLKSRVLSTAHAHTEPATKPAKSARGTKAAAKS